MNDRPSELDPLLAENRANWNSRVPIHLGPGGYEIERYVEDPARISEVVAFDTPTLGDLTGLSVVHLQCHIGTDTISLARLGATEVVGVDFSDAALHAARDLTTQTGDNARFVLSDVYQAAATVDQRFDLLYTSVGTICWLDDIDQWAANVAGLLKPAGRFVFRDLHPVMWTYEEVDGHIAPHYPYWQPRGQPLSSEWPESYLGTGTIASPRTNEWNHTVAEVLNALINSGLRIDHLEEHPGCDWKLVPSAIAEGTQYFLPDGLRDKLPVCWTITATKA
ncbi:MAG: class I SAM-dependent methyltransferase [Actinomycetia bacterium]|nr:class I SAM-dependent methyltransferase [Actinomycetes bacterium]